MTIEQKPVGVDIHQFYLRRSIKDKLLYIETRLNYRLPVAPVESWILVVNIHER
jgi:hypothetical protein